MQILRVRCEKCDGTGRVASAYCEKCHGHGYYIPTKSSAENKRPLSVNRRSNIAGRMTSDRSKDPN